MKRLTKQHVLIPAVPIVCLAVGLWMHNRYTVSSVTKALQSAAWSDMEAGASSFIAHLRRGMLPRTSSEPTMADQVARMAGEHPPLIGRVLVLGGASGRPITADDDGGPAPAVGAVAVSAWHPAPGTTEQESAGRRGRLLLPDGVHLGLVYWLKDKRGRVVVHQPLSDIEERAAAACANLPTISLLTFSWVCTLLGIATYLAVARFQDQLRQQKSRSTTDSLRQIQSLLRTRDAVIFGLAKLAESRDPETGHHLERISVYSTTLATELRRHAKYRDDVSPAFVRLIGISSALHDIGKVGVPDRILQKRGSLTEEERNVMQRHAALGGDCLREIEQRLGGSSFLRMAREIAYAHHERWDGRGYPDGLRHDGIPLSARIVALTDMYDALSSKRVYKEAMPHEECLAIIRREASEKLDPGLVEVWLGIEGRFRSIAKRYARGAEALAPLDLTSVSPGQEVDALLEDWQVVSESGARL